MGKLGLLGPKAPKTADADDKASLKSGDSPAKLAMQGFVDAVKAGDVDAALDAYNTLRDAG